MPKGPEGQHRPADVVGCAIHVAKIATGEIKESTPKKRVPARAAGGVKGSRKRSRKLSRRRRVEIARNAAQARWSRR